MKLLAPRFSVQALAPPQRRQHWRIHSLDVGQAGVPVAGIDAGLSDEDVEAEAIAAEAPANGNSRGNNKLTMGSLVELVGMGMGVPMPSSVELDMENKVLRMEFEANNFDQKYAYQDSCYVDEDEDMMKKLGNFFGFGKKKSVGKAEDDAK